MKKIGLSLLLATGLISSNVIAADAIDATPFFKMGYGFGGDKVGELEIEDGADQDVTAGGGFTIGGGLSFPINSLDLGKDVGLNLSAAYHFDSATASNADLTFDRFEFGIMPYVKLNEKVTLAAGVEFHTGVEYEIEFNSSDAAFEFDSATALAAELIFSTQSNFQWSIKAAMVDYTSDITEDISGNNISAFFVYSM